MKLTTVQISSLSENLPNQKMEDIESSPSHQPKAQNSTHHGYSAPSLSVDSGTYSAEAWHVVDSSETVHHDEEFCNQINMNGFSEEELLNITFEACDTARRGQVLVSTVMQYLSAMTGHSPGQDKLTILRYMLDPEGNDPPINRDTFHTTMTKWIVQCSQDKLCDNIWQTPGLDSCKAAGNAIVYSPSVNETTFTDQAECHCESNDLFTLVADLKQAQHSLSGQNSVLLKTVSQCEEANLQLALEVSELRSKLDSVQQCVVRAQSQTEELDETKEALRENQDRVTRSQAHNRALKKEIEHLKAHIKVIEEKNVRLTLESNCAEDQLNKLKRANRKLREELEETHILLAVKEREIARKNITLQKLKDTYLEHYKIIESLQSELVRLQEHSHQALLGFDKCSLRPSSLKGGGVPNPYSLHHEILEAQPDAVCNYTGEMSERAFQDQQMQACSKQQFMTVLRDALWEEQEQKLAEALRLGAERSHVAQEAQEAARAIQDQMRTLESNLRAAQQEVGESRQRTAAMEQELTELREAQNRAEGVRVTRRKDVAVMTELTGDVSGGNTDRQHTVAQGVMESLRRVEVTVGRTLQATQLLIHMENRLRERVEAISQRMEEALGMAAGAASQLSALERRFSTNTKSSVISAHPDVRSVDASHTVICNRGSASHTELESVSRPCSPNPSLQTNGGLLHTGAKDNNHKGYANHKVSQDTNDPTQALHVNPSDLWVNCTSAIISEASAPDPLPVELVNNPPVHNTCKSSSAVTHSPFPETSPGPACEELPCLHAPESAAGPEGPGCGDSSLTEREERECSEVSLEEVVSGKTSETKANKCPTRKSEGSGRSEEASTKSGSSKPELSELSQVFDLVDKERPLYPECSGNHQAFNTPSPSEGVSECSGRSKEESEASGRSQEETRAKGFLKELTTCCTHHVSELESGKEEHFDTSQSGSVQGTQFHLTDSAAAGNHGKDLSATCGESRPSVRQASPRPLHWAVTQTDSPFIFPLTRSRPPNTPAMPTLPEEEEDSAEEVDSSSSSPSTYMPAETKAAKVTNVTIAPPTIVLPRQATKQDSRPLDKPRPLSPRPRLSRTTSASGPLTTVDNDGHVIDLVKGDLPELLLSDEDRQKNLELLEEAKKVSDRFLTRRGRRSTCSLTESPTGPSPIATPSSSPAPSRSSSLSAPPQTASVTDATITLFTSSPTRLEVPAGCDHGETDHESLRKLVNWKPPEKRKVSSGTLTPRHNTTGAARHPAVALTESPESSKPEGPAPATGVAKPVPRPTTQQAPCTAEIKTIGAFPPLMRAVSWDTVGSVGGRNGAPKSDEDLAFSDKLKSSGYKDFPLAPANVHKLSKLREEHKLMRNQSISGPKLPDLSETAEQERGSCSTATVSSADEEAKDKADTMPNISDLMLRKLKLHRGSAGACAPPLTEKEVENAFVQLSLAFRNDNYTLETRLKLAEHERNLTEENTEKELEEFKNSLKSTAPMWQNLEQRESYQRLMETVAVLHRLANRLSSRAEMVGAVRQEKRLNKATEVMLHYVENLKRTYEKDHAELMEFKKLANQNSNRYCGSMETGEDGIARQSRSMSLTLGKALPRRRVSVAVVPKFNLLNIPGQSPATVGAGPGSAPGPTPGPSPGPAPSAGTASASGTVALPVLCEANSMKSPNPMDPPQQGARENGKAMVEQDGDTAMATKAPCSPEEIRAQIKAKIEEEAYNKGYQEGLKRIKELQDVKEEEESAEEKQLMPDQIIGEEPEKENKTNSRYEEALEAIDRLCPKIFKRSWTLWMVLTLFIGLFFLVNLVNTFRNYYGEHGDTSAGRSAVPAKKTFFGPHVSSKSSPTPE